MAQETVLKAAGAPVVAGEKLVSPSQHQHVSAARSP